jgi:hypothetical protein
MWRSGDCLLVEISFGDRRGAGIGMDYHLMGAACRDDVGEGAARLTRKR